MVHGPRLPRTHTHAIRHRLSASRLLATLAAAILLSSPALAAPARATDAGTIAAPIPAYAPPPRSATPIRLDAATDSTVLNGQATRIGAENPQQMLRLVFTLYPPHKAQEQQFLHDVQTKGSPLYRHFLTADEWNARFAPSAADEQAVVDWAKAQGLTVTQHWPNRLTVNVSAPVAAIQHAFDVTLNTYKVGHTTFLAADRGPQIPARLSNVVSDVLGLDSRQVFRSGLVNTHRVPTTADPAYSPGPVVGAATTFTRNGDHAAFVRAMAGRPATSHNAASGIAPHFTNGYYDPTDIYSSQAYDYVPLFYLSRCCNPLNNPGGAPGETTIAIAGVDAVTDADLQGFAQQYPYVAFNVTKVPIGGTPQTGTGNAEETTLDTEYATAMSNDFGSSASTAHVYVYEAADSSIGALLTDYQSIDNSAAGIMSTSFFVPEAIAGSAVANNMDSIFAEMVSRGKTIVAAAGDNGPYASNDPNNLQSCVPNTPIAVLPASDPNVVAAGGTTLTLNADGSYNNETTWQGPSNYCGYNQGGGGAGCSSFFNAQSYQQSLVAEAPCFGKRGYPDLSLNASASTLQNFFFNGSLQAQGGTSIVAPELAGFFAQERSYLLTLGNICGSGGTRECAALGNADYPMYYAGTGGAPHLWYYDIQSGCDGNAAGLGYCASIGYDVATGWGSANMLQLAWDINYESTQDTGAPLIGFSGVTPNTWYGHVPLAVTLNITDTGGSGAPSGVAGYSWAWDSDPGDPYNEAHPGAGNSFYNGPELLASSGTVYLNSNLSQGCHTLYVRAWDNQGLEADGQAYGAPHTYGPICYDTTPPVVNSITFNPASPSSATSVQISASASDPGASSGTGSGVSHIDYYVNTATDGSASGAWNLIGTSTGASGSVAWNTSGYAAGTHLVQVKVYDNALNCDCGSPSIDNTATYTLNSSAVCPPAGNPTASSYAQAILADHPLGYWRLDETCVGTVADSSGHGLNGMASGVTPNQPGAIADGDAAMSFNGSSSYVSLGDPAALQPRQVSVEAWVKTSSTTPQIVVRKRFYGYVLAVNSGGLPAFTIDDSLAIGYTAQGQTSIADGKWHYLVGSYDGSTVRLYVDGAQVGAQPAGTIYYQPDLVAIGRDGGAAGSYFSGSIDDVAIYGTALSATRVQAHYSAAAQANPTPTATNTATSTPTNTATSMPTVTPTNTPTSTPVPPTATPTNTATPTATATNTPQPAATLVASAGSGMPYQTITVTGTNFGATEMVKVYLDSAGTTPLTATLTGAGGAFTAHVTLPQATGGAHHLLAVEQSSGRTATAALTVNPDAFLAHASGRQGSANSLLGFGFAAGEPVKAYWYPGLSPLGGTTTNALGSFAGSSAISFTVPMSATGTYYVLAVGQHSHSMAVSRFVLTP